MALPPPYYQQDGITIYHGDCREILPSLSADLILTDPPYGTTSNAWDKAFAPDELASLLRSYKTVVMTASQPFSSLAVCADIKRFRHEWVWVKNRGSNFANTVREPMKEHEVVLVFSDGKWTYNKQMEERRGGGRDRVGQLIGNKTDSTNYKGFSGLDAKPLPELRVPSSVQKFNTEVGLHPTQKPVPLFEYLVRTYSNPGDRIVDPFMGSGPALVSAQRLGRVAVGIDSDEHSCEIAAKRLQQSVLPLGV